jgi:hypothetical protein
VRRAIDLAGNRQLVARLRQGARASTLALDWSHICLQVEAIWERLIEQQALGACGFRLASV